MTIQLSDNNGSTWTTIESVSNGSGWVVHTARIADFVSLTSQVRVRFNATDNPNDSVTEAAIDRFRIEDFVCDAGGCPADIDGDGDADGDDFFGYLDLFASGDPDADLDGDGDRDADDFFMYLDLFAQGC
ncbi:MAG: hypothetical protein H6811_08370 [Phycisphaeraceae bacterium]|nr:hypothetical protein [Phycisphaeraceae bacterium]